MTVCSAKTQISMGIRPVWSEFSLCAQWLADDPSFRHADSEDSDQTGRMHDSITDQYKTSNNLFKSVLLTGMVSYFLHRAQRNN